MGQEKHENAPALPLLRLGGLGGEIVTDAAFCGDAVCVRAQFLAQALDVGI